MKKSVKRIKKNKEKKDNQELEKILEKEIKEDEEKPKQEITKIKPLKEIKQIDIDAFQKFFYSKSKFIAPVLNQVETVQETINLEQGVSKASTHARINNKDDSFKYAAGKIGEDEKHYIASSAQMRNQVAQVDLMKIGREKDKFREVQFMQAPELQGIKNQDQERYLPAKTFNPQDLGRDNILKQKEVGVKKMDYEPLH